VDPHTPGARISPGSLIALGLIACVVSYQVFLPPAVGIANNGDFAKIAGEVGLGVPQEGNNVARFAYLHYVFDPKFDYRSGFWSSELLLFTTALAVNHVLSKTGTFDIRAMGAVHAILLIATFWLLLPLLPSMRRAPRWLVLALAAFFFTDVMYASY
jgi:hypothetical protein